MRRGLGLGLVAVLVLGLVAPTSAAITFVQTMTCQTVAASTCTTPATTTTNGNLFVPLVAYCCATGLWTSNTDNKSNTWTTAIAEFAAGVNTVALAQYVAAGTGGAGHTFTANFSGSTYTWLTVVEISGASATPLDRTATGTASDSSHTTAATATTTQAAELLLGFGASVNATTYTTDTGAGWTQVLNHATAADDMGMLVGRRTVAATGAYTYTYTTSASVEAIAAILTFKEAAAAAGTRQRCVGCGADPKVIE